MTDQLSLYEQVQSTLTGEMFRILGLDPQGLMRKIFGFGLLEFDSYTIIEIRAYVNK